MSRLSPTLRALLLVPLLAAGVDQARAVVLCGSGAQSCLEAAGRGWIGLWGVALIGLYSVALALAVARGARAAGVAPPGFLRLWGLGTAGVAAACGGQGVIAAALGGAPLGGGWLGVVALCAVAGALLALALRIAPALRRSLRAAAPRLAGPAASLSLAPAPLAAFAGGTVARRPRGRAPPLAI
jgi:hypothetical protein